MRGTWCAILLVSLALAGCSDGKDKGDDGDAAADDAAGSVAALLTAKAELAVNGTRIAAVNGSFVVERGVAITFDASNSTGPIVTYAWDFGDNATSTDRSEEHTYAEPGNYTAKLTVANGNVSANATLNLTVGGVTLGEPLFASHEEFSGSLPLGNPNSPTTPGTDYNDHPVVVAAADANGTAALAVVARITMQGSGLPTNQYFVYWIGPDGTELATSGDIGDVASEHIITYEGDMPAGDYSLRVRLFVGAAADYTATVDLDYVTA